MQKHIIPAFDALAKDADELNILDICFGLGFNTLASISYAKKHYPNLKLNIFSPELNAALVKSLINFSYPAEIENIELIKSISERFIFEDERYSVRVAIGDARESLRDVDKKFDIVYQDAFSPAKNPRLWSSEYFSQISSFMSKKALITTYSRSTAVKIAMFNAGLNIYELKHDGIRSSTVAANFELSNLKKIDMLMKMKNSPNTKPLSDKDIDGKR
jgi:tRNA U34 5-methylaminomethyl-2-thiouridine-forming methyltransferase MnmC